MSTTSETTQQTPDPAIAARLDELAHEYGELRKINDPISRRLDEIKDEFRRLLRYGTYQHAGQNIAIQHNPQFDSAAFQAAFPQQQYGHLYKTEPDRKAITQHIAPAQRAAFQREGTPKVIVS